MIRGGPRGILGGAGAAFKRLEVGERHTRTHDTSPSPQLRALGVHGPGDRSGCPNGEQEQGDETLGEGDSGTLTHASGRSTRSSRLYHLPAAATTLGTHPGPDAEQPVRTGMARAHTGHPPGNTVSSSQNTGGGGVGAGKPPPPPPPGAPLGPPRPPPFSSTHHGGGGGVRAAPPPPPVTPAARSGTP